MDEKKHQNKGNLKVNSLSEDTLDENAERINLKKGETLNLSVYKETDELIYKKKKYIKLSKGVDSEFLEVLDNVLDDYEEALYSLKEK